MKKSFIILTVAALTGFSVKQQFADKNAIAEANQVQGLFVFVDSKPMQEHTTLGTVDLSKKASRKSGVNANPQYSIIRDALITEARNDYPQADGIILHLNAGGKDYATVIQFKK